MSPAATTEFGSELIAEAANAPSDPPRMTKRQIGLMWLATFTLYISWIAPLGFSLAVRISQIDAARKDAVLPIALSVPGIIVLFITPLIGVLSDRTRSRLGRRRPWMLAGIVVGAIGALVLGLATSIAGVIGGWTIAFIGYTIIASMISTHLGDRLPESQRGKVLGVNGALTQIAPVAGVVIAGTVVSTPAAMFLIPGALAFVGCLVFALVMKDGRLEGQAAPLKVDALLRGFWFNPRKHRNLGWVVLSRAMIFLALSFLSVYGVYLLGQRLGYDAQKIAALSASVGGGGVLAATLGAIGSGTLSDRLRSRKPFLVVSALLLAVSMLLIGTLTTPTQFVIGSLLSSFAIGVYGAVDQATGLDVMPREGENGRYLAIFGLGNQVPQSFGPLLAGVALGLFGGQYGAVYVVGAAFAVLGALAIFPIRLERRARTKAAALA